MQNWFHTLKGRGVSVQKRNVLGSISLSLPTPLLRLASSPSLIFSTFDGIGSSGSDISSLRTHTGRPQMHMKQVQLEQGILNVVIAGTFDLALAKIEFVDMLDEVVRSGTTKVLIDGQQMTGKPGDFERFLYGDFVARTSLDLMEELGVELRFA